DPRSLANPVPTGRRHRRRPQGVRDTRMCWTCLSPTLESPPHAFQSGRNVASLAGTHWLSSRMFCPDNQRYHTPQTDSYTLAGRTQPVEQLIEHDHVIFEPG